VILGLDTATSATTAAVYAPGGPEVERRDDPEPGARPAHAGRLLRLVEDVLGEAGASWDDVERIAVGIGPGGFTGLRIGIATARGLAQTRGLPLVGVSTLEALASAARAESGREVVAVIDARRGEVFTSLADAPLAPEELAARIPPGALAVGDGAVRFRDELEQAGALVPVDGSGLHRVSALQVCRLGATADPADRDALLPDYRREPDAKPPRLP